MIDSHSISPAGSGHGTDSALSYSPDRRGGNDVRCAPGGSHFNHRRLAGACELSIVVPVYREGPALEASVARIRSCARQATTSFEIIVVDDGSDDATWPVVVALARAYAEVRGIQLSRNFGKDAAISAGLSFTTGAAAIVLDADLQHPPELIPQFHALWKQGYDIVDGVKRVRRDEPRLRRLGSAAFNRLARRMTGLDLEDSTDFKLLSRAAIDAWASIRESRLFFRGIVEWLGFRRARVPFEVAPSVRPASTWSFARLVRLGGRAIVSFSSIPLRIAHVASLAFMLLGAVLGLEAVWLKVAGRAVDGFTTVIVLQLIQGGLILAVLAVISEYLAAIYDEAKARPRFVVAAVTPPSGSAGSDSSS